VQGSAQVDGEGLLGAGADGREAERHLAVLGLSLGLFLGVILRAGRERQEGGAVSGGGDAEVDDVGALAGAGGEPEGRGELTRSRGA
jgi:hypothetical protein